LRNFGASRIRKAILELEQHKLKQGFKAFRRRRMLCIVSKKFAGGISKNLLRQSLTRWHNFCAEDNDKQE